MNTSFMKIFLGILCNVFLMTNNLLVNGYNCIYLTSNHLRSVQCKNSDFDEVPRDFDVQTEEMIFENVTFQQMSENSFSIYTNLAIIKMKSIAYINTHNPIHGRIFRGLSKLNTLSIENVFTKFNASFNYPPNLQKLSLSQNDFIEHLDLRSALSLTEFYAFACSLRSFPRFNKSAPLVTIDVRWNPLDNWTAEDLAPFCLLRNISIEWGENAILTEPDRFCQCVRLENWMKNFNISTVHSLNCTPPENISSTHCHTEYSKEALQQRNECLARNVRPLEHQWVNITALSLVSISFTAAGYFSLRTRMVKRQTKSPKPGSPKPTKKPAKVKHQSSTKPPEKTERGGEVEYDPFEDDEEKEKPEAVQRNENLKNSESNEEEDDLIFEDEPED